VPRPLGRLAAVNSPQVGERGRR